MQIVHTTFILHYTTIICSWSQLVHIDKILAENGGYRVVVLPSGDQK